MVTRGGGPSSRSVDRAPSCHEVMSRPARVADVQHLGEMRLRFALSDGLVAQERAIEPRPPAGKESHAAHRRICVPAPREMALASAGQTSKLGRRMWWDKGRRVLELS